jgi:cysteine desulfurase
MMNMIYLDYAATTPVHPLVLTAFKRAAIKYPGNPNSGHCLGLSAAKAIEKSLKRMRLALGLPKEYELTPTSGASESNNLALKGIAFKIGNQGKTIITTAFEHSSTTASANYLAKLGYNIQIAPCDAWGRVDVVALETMINQDTILVSIGSINSEIGIRQPIEQIKKMLRKHPHVIFHVDATQSLGKEAIDLNGIDLISLTAHKIFGIKGVGLLIAHERAQLVPLIHGGHSTTRARRGTPATELVLSMEKALRLALANLDDNYRHVENINHYVRGRLQAIPDVIINSTEADLPHILNFSLVGKTSRAAVNFFSDHGICISNHTACESEIDLSSAVFALTHHQQRAISSVRLSFSYLTTNAEIDRFIETINEYLS